MEASIGHNSARYGEDEIIPPKAERKVSIERANQLLVSARLISTLYRTPKNRILEKRKGGEDGRALRRFLIFYARGLGAPVWECAEIFDLNRKQIGQEEASYLDMLARNPDLEEDVESMISMLDYALKVNTSRFITVSITEIEAEAAAKKAVKVAREAADMLERNAPAKPKPKPEPPSEAALIVADMNAKRRIAHLESLIRIAKSVIIAGGKDNSTKQQKADARRAVVELDHHTAEIAKLQKQRKA